MLGIKRYSCHYLDPAKKVYAITPANVNVHHNIQRAYLSIPLVEREQKRVTQAIVAFVHPHLCEETNMLVKTTSEVESERIELCVSQLREYAQLMKLPMVVVLNMYCDLNEKEEHFEIFYVGPHSKRDMFVRDV